MTFELNLDELLSKDDSKIYFVGIGGIAMSAAANIATSFGYEVLGSDSKEVYSPAKDVLDSNKINYYIGYKQEQAKDSQADLFVLSAGEDLTNPEVKYIIDNDLPRVGLAELLYELSKDKLRIVVAGTHGKSTTAGLLGHLVKNLDNSSFMAGGVLQNYQSNFSIGDGHYFIFEGDEYKEQFDDPTPKFHFYKADILVLTNLEYDHPDQFSSLEDLEREFELLIEAMPGDGLIIYNADNAVLARLVHQSNVASVGFGIDNETDFQAVDIDFGADFTQHHFSVQSSDRLGEGNEGLDGQGDGISTKSGVGFTAFQVKNKNTKDQLVQLLGATEEYKIQLPGKINVYNALAALTTLRTLGFTRENLLLDLISYKGIKRRFELVGTKNGITIIDDYAHHPTAVRETLEAARLKFFSHPLPMGEGRGEGQMPGKIWAVFEPHTFSRTKATLPDLAKSFDSADEILIADIYPAREKASDATISSQEVVDAVKGSVPPPGLPAEALAKVGGGRLGGGANVRLVHAKPQALSILKSESKPGDVIIIMAVGSFNRLAYELKDIL